MTKKYKYLQSIVNYRIEIKEDGTLGNPEITKKWTMEMGAPKAKKKAKVNKKTVVAKIQKARTL